MNIKSHILCSTLTWLHDVPGVLPPREPGQYPELHAHHPQSQPLQLRRPLLSLCIQGLPLSLEWSQLLLEGFELANEALLLRGLKSRRKSGFNNGKGGRNSIIKEIWGELKRGKYRKRQIYGVDILNFAPSSNPGFGVLSGNARENRDNFFLWLQQKICILSLYRTLT